MSYEFDYNIDTSKFDVTYSEDIQESVKYTNEKTSEYDESVAKYIENMEKVRTQFREKRLIYAYDLTTKETKEVTLVGDIFVNKTNDIRAARDAENSLYVKGTGDFNKLGFIANKENCAIAGGWISALQDFYDKNKTDQEMRWYDNSSLYIRLNTINPTGYNYNPLKDFELETPEIHDRLGNRMHPIGFRIKMRYIKRNLFNGTIVSPHMDNLRLILYYRNLNEKKSRSVLVELNDDSESGELFEHVFSDNDIKSLYKIKIQTMGAKADIEIADISYLFESDRWIKVAEKVTNMGTFKLNLNRDFNTITLEDGTTKIAGKLIGSVTRDKDSPYTFIDIETVKESILPLKPFKYDQKSHIEYFAQLYTCNVHMDHIDDDKAFYFNKLFEIENPFINMSRGKIKKNKLCALEVKIVTKDEVYSFFISGKHNSTKQVYNIYSDYTINPVYSAELRVDNLKENPDTITILLGLRYSVGDKVKIEDIKLFEKMVKAHIIIENITGEKLKLYEGSNIQPMNLYYTPEPGDDGKSLYIATSKSGFFGGNIRDYNDRYNTIQALQKIVTEYDTSKEIYMYHISYVLDTLKEKVWKSMNKYKEYINTSNETNKILQTAIKNGDIDPQLIYHYLSKLNLTPDKIYKVDGLVCVGTGQYKQIYKLNGLRISDEIDLEDDILERYQYLKNYKFGIVQLFLSDDNYIHAININDHNINDEIRSKSVRYKNEFNSTIDNDIDKMNRIFGITIYPKIVNSIIYTPPSTTKSFTYAFPELQEKQYYKGILEGDIKYEVRINPGYHQTLNMDNRVEYNNNRARFNNIAFLDAIIWSDEKLNAPQP